MNTTHALLKGCLWVLAATNDLELKKKGKEVVDVREQGRIKGQDKIQIKADVIQSPINPMEWFILTSEVVRDGVWRGTEQISSLMAEMLFLQMFCNRGHDVYSKIIISKKRVTGHFVSF